MAEKRYVIVRADRFCPRDLERNYNLKCIGSLHCDKCDLRKKYGDTKEQLIKKVATVFSMEKIIVAKDLNEYKYKLAKEIVEFLGVE